MHAWTVYYFTLQIDFEKYAKNGNTLHYVVNWNFYKNSYFYQYNFIAHDVRQTHSLKCTHNNLFSSS